MSRAAQLQTYVALMTTWSLLSIITLAFLPQACFGSRTDALHLADPFRTGMATRRGRRIDMEDRVGAWNFKCPGNGSPGTSYGIWAVFDGHGSTAISAYLEAALHVHLRRRLCEAARGSLAADEEEPALPCRPDDCGQCNHIRKALLRAFQDVDADLQQQGQLEQQGQRQEQLSQQTLDGGHRPQQPSSSSISPPAESSGAPSSILNSASPGTAAASPWRNGSVAADGLGVQRAAAAAAAWDAGSTAVVAVVEWVGSGGAACQHDGAVIGADCTAGAAAPSQLQPADGGGEGAAMHAEAAAARDGASCSGAASHGGGCGQLWIASLGNSPAVLCVPAAPVQGAGGGGSEGGDGDWSAVAKADGAKGRPARGPAASDKPPGAGIGSGGVGSRRRLISDVLTVSHDMQNMEEVRRVAAAGGIVKPNSPGGRRRLMGDLEVSRAFGDLQYRQYGLNAEPDIAGPWMLGDGINDATGPDGDDAADREEASKSAKGRSLGGKDGGGTGPGLSAVGAGRAGRLVAPHLLLASDGILEAMTPQDMCDHLAAQLTGAAEPPLTSAPPPAIALGPATSKEEPSEAPLQGPHDSPSAASGSHEDLASSKLGPTDLPPWQADAAAKSRDKGGLPGCCDCELRAAAQGSQVDGDEVEDPCAAQALRRASNRRPDRRTIQDAAIRLVQEAVNQGSMDNVAAVVVQMPGLRSPHPRVPDRNDGACAAPTAATHGLTASTARASPSPPDTTAPPRSVMSAVVACAVAGTPAAAALSSRFMAPPGLMFAPGGSAPGAQRTEQHLTAADTGPIPSTWDQVQRMGADVPDMSGRQVAHWVAQEALAATTMTAAATSPAATTQGGPTERPLMSVQLRCRAISAWSPPARTAGPSSLPDVAAHRVTSDIHRCAASWATLRALHARSTSYVQWLLGRVAALLRRSPRSDGASRPLGSNGDMATSAIGGVKGEVPAPFSLRQPAGDGADGAGAVIALVCPQHVVGSHADIPAAWVARGISSFTTATATASAATTLVSDFCEVPSSRQGISLGFGVAGTDNEPKTTIAGREPLEEGRVEAAEEDQAQDEVLQVSYGYVLAERITGVPSAPRHLHASLPGGEAVEPWRLSDFDGAATFVTPGLAGVDGTVWLLDRLQLYCSRPYDTQKVATAVVADVGVHLSSGNCEANLDGGGADGSSSSSSSSHALMSLGSTHSLLLEIAAVPLQLTLFDSSDEGPFHANAAGPGGSGDRGNGAGLVAPTTYTIDDGHGMQYDDAAPVRAWLPGSADRDSKAVAPLSDNSAVEHGHNVASIPGTVWEHPMRPIPPPDGAEAAGPVRDAAAGLAPTPQLSLSPDPWDGPSSALGVSGRRNRVLLHTAPGLLEDQEGADGGGGDGGADGGGGLRLATVPAAAAAPAAGYRAVGAAVAGGPQLRFQPRAHGVRLADGALHLVTDEAQTASASSGIGGIGGGNNGHDTHDDIGEGGDALAHSYRLRERFGQGHFGEVWRAWRLDRYPMRNATEDTVRPGDGASGQSSAGGQRPSVPGEAAGAEASAASAAAAAEAVARGPPLFVLKRLRGHGGHGILLSGLREAYFGGLLRRLQAAATLGALGQEAAARWRSDRSYGHLVDFLESFEVVSEGTDVPPDLASKERRCAGCDNGRNAGYEPYRGGVGDSDEVDLAGEGCGGVDSNCGSTATESPPPDLWLVFRDAGRSLHDLIYSPIGLRVVEEDEEQAAADRGEEQEQQKQQQAAGPAFQVLGPSPWWQAMRRHPRGNDFIRHLLRQLLLGLQTVHEANITHRDVKPENMLLRPMTRGSSYETVHDSPTANQRHQPTGSQTTHEKDGPQHSRTPPRAPPSPARQWLGVATFGTWFRSDGGVDVDDANDGSGSGDAGRPNDEDDAVAPAWLRLIDFGSAVDDYSLQHLYGSEGPTSDQLTLEYAPPEALFGRYWEGMKAMRPRAWAYDIWSVGVVWLELLMATPQVWQLPAATRALLEARLALHSRPESERQLVFLLRGLMEWCIYPPQAPSTPPGPPLRGRKSRLLMSWSCTEEALLALAKSRDPLGLGLEGPMALRLLLRLLHWDPSSRPSARQALQHAFFMVKPSSWALHVCGASVVGDPGWC